MGGQSRIAQLLGPNHSPAAGSPAPAPHPLQPRRGDRHALGPSSRPALLHGRPQPSWGSFERNPHTHAQHLAVSSIFASFTMFLPSVYSAAQRLGHWALNMTYRKRMVVYFALFAFSVVQLALFQSKHKRYDGITMTVHDENNDFIVSLDVFFLLAALTIFCTGWVVRPVFEQHILTLNTLLVALISAWIIIAATYAHLYYANLICNVCVLAYLVACDVYTLQHRGADVVAVKRSPRSSGTGVLYNTLAARTDGAADPASRSSDADADPCAVTTYPRINLLEKGAVTHGFRVNLALVPVAEQLRPRTDLRFDDFTDVTHLVDSSSCHIHTALWKGVPVVLKLIKEDRVNNAVAVAEFEIEEQLLSHVRHPHIVRLLGSGVVPRKFLVLELLSRGSLAHRLGLATNSTTRTAFAPLSFLQALRIALALARALEYLHLELSPQIHVLHRDLKPDNIGFDAAGNVKLFDFGLCAIVKRHALRGDVYKLTGNTGTLRYMAPEVVLNRAYNESVDVYSFGILCWQMATNRVPFKEMSKKQFFDDVVLRNRRLALSKHWPEDFVHLLSRCWHEDMGQRPDFQTVRRELEQVLTLEEERVAQREARCWAQLLRHTQRVVVEHRAALLGCATLLLVLGAALTASGAAVIVGALLGGAAAAALHTLTVRVLPEPARASSSPPRIKRGRKHRARSLDVSHHEGHGTDDEVDLEVGTSTSEAAPATALTFNPLRGGNEEMLSRV